MKLALPGQSCLKSRLITLLLLGNGTLLFGLTAGCVCYRLLFPLPLSLTGGHQPLFLFAFLQFAFALFGLAGLGWLLSRRIDRLISAPIRRLAEKMELVSES